jgi:hypothetical protein
VWRTQTGDGPSAENHRKNNGFSQNADGADGADANSAASTPSADSVPSDFDAVLEELAARDDDYPDLPECLRRVPKSGNGIRPPRGKGWHLVGDKPPGEAGARVFIRERWPPALGPKGDDVFDIDPSWRR